MTPLVGAPGEICRALAEHAGVDARWVVLAPGIGAYGQMKFQLDWVWTSDKEEVLSFADNCDVFHLHNFLDLESTEFMPISFRKLWMEGRAVIRHLHSTPDLIQRTMSDGRRRLADCPLPQLVIAQYPERQFPRARLVPNIVPMDSQGTSNQPPGRLRIGYAPSRFNSARSSRWDTKAYPETMKVLRRVQKTMAEKGRPIQIDVIEQVSHEVCLRRKAACQIIVDDLATGSYHLNTLESLAQGAVCLTYLDRRTQQAIADLTGRHDFPAISAGLEDATEVLVDLCMRPEVVAGLGRASRDWMMRHWHPGVMSSHFVSAYEALLADPRAPFPVRDGGDCGQAWARTTLFDLQWRSRQRSWPTVAPPWVIDAKGSVGKVLRRWGLRK